MFARYTESAQRAIVLAQDEARQHRHGAVGTGVLLLGLLRLEGKVAWMALKAAGVDPQLLRRKVIELMGPGQSDVRGEIGFTPAAKRVMVELAIDEARHLKHNYVGTEHLLLALCHDDGHAGAALRSFGLTRDGLVEKVLHLLGTGGASPMMGIPLEETSPSAPPIRYSQALLAALRSAAEEARSTGSAEVLPEHLLMALLTVPEETSVRALLLRHGLTLEELRRHLSEDA